MSGLAKSERHPEFYHGCLFRPPLLSQTVPRSDAKWRSRRRGAAQGGAESSAEQREAARGGTEGAAVRYRDCRCGVANVVCFLHPSHELINCTCTVYTHVKKISPVFALPERVRLSFWKCIKSHA